MRRSMVVLCVVVAGLLVACGETKVVTETVTGGGSSSSNSSTAASAQESGASIRSTSNAATIGSTIRLTGQESTHVAEVTVVPVVDPAQGSDQYTAPDRGKRLVAVQVRIKNAGAKPLQEFPDNDGQLVDARGQAYEADLNEVSAGPSFPVPVTITPADVRLGFVVFQVPKGVADGGTGS